MGGPGLAAAPAVQREVHRGEGLRVDVQVGGRRRGGERGPHRRVRVPRGGDHAQPRRLGLAAALDGDRALAHAALPPRAAGAEHPGHVTRDGDTGTGYPPETHHQDDADKQGEEAEGDDLAHGVGVEHGAPQQKPLLAQAPHTVRHLHWSLEAE